MNQNDIHRAWLFAAEKHNKQLYPGTNLPYIIHIGAVCLELSEALRAQSSAEVVDITAKLLDKTPSTYKKQNSFSLTNCTFALVCAILHDVVEDTDATIVEIENKFGKSVAEGVSALTKDTTIVNKTDQLIDSLRRIKVQPKEIWMVKLADRIANLSQFPTYWKTEKCVQYLRDSELIFDYLSESSETLKERLKEKINEWKKNFLK